MEDQGKRPQVGHGQTERRGVAILDQVVNEPRERDGLGFLFREMTTFDYGIDGHIEVVETVDERSEPTGKIVSVQVKSGASFLRPSTGDSWVVPIKKSTVEYWRSHSVPVLLVVVDVDGRVCYWIRGDTYEHAETKEHYKVRVPKRNVLNGGAARRIAELADESTVVERRLAALETDLPLMNAALRGEVAVIDLMRWVNKSSGRTDYHIGLRDSDATDADPPYMRSYFRGSALSSGGVTDLASYLAPWADAVADTDSYDLLAPDRDDLYQEYLQEYGAWDNEDGMYFDVLDEFPEWLDKKYGGYAGLVAYPYRFTPETEHFRLRLEPNGLGEGFPVVYRYLKNLNEEASGAFRKRTNRRPLACSGPARGVGAGVKASGSSRSRGRPDQDARGRRLSAHITWWEALPALVSRSSASTVF
jgi:hypothetical protein